MPCDKTSVIYFLVRGNLTANAIYHRPAACPETLARLVREEAVVRPARGLYQLPDAHVEAAHTLAEAAVLVPKGVVCLTSALQYHELTLQMPSAVWMAIDRVAWRPKIDYPAIRFERF